MPPQGRASRLKCRGGEWQRSTVMGPNPAWEECATLRRWLESGLFQESQIHETVLRTWVIVCQYRLQGKEQKVQAGPGVKLYHCAPGLADLYRAPTVYTAYTASSQEASRANWILSSCYARFKSVLNSPPHRKRLDVCWAQELKRMCRRAKEWPDRT